jgi:16S rRNA (adenine1518-N6/adenine1519-N6)-dimethyltransferase
MRFRPKKRLGQHFLIDGNIRRKIIKACEIAPDDTVLEIGSGRGELTRLIAEKTDKLFALEFDPRLCSVLKSELADCAWVKIINRNILYFDIARFFKNAPKVKVIGNLPYNITTPIIVHLLKFRGKIKDIFITVQKEFGQRMVASPGSSDWSSFSCFLQYYTQPQIQFFIKKTCFWPQPKVDSVLVKLNLKEKLPLDRKKEKRLFKIIRSSFQQRRKTLKNALSGVVSSRKLSRYFNQYNIDKNIRGEQLSLQDFINLVNFNG